MSGLEYSFPQEEELMSVIDEMLEENIAVGAGVEGNLEVNEGDVCESCDFFAKAAESKLVSDIVSENDDSEGGEYLLGLGMLIGMRLERKRALQFIAKLSGGK